MSVIEITDLSAPELAVYTSLTGPQLRSKRHPEQGMFIVESATVIGHGLDAGYAPVSLLMERQKVAAHEALLARCGDVPVYVADRAVLETLTGYALTRGILCAMRRPMLPPAEQVLKDARRIAVLENIGDGANVGAIFRAAAALNVDGVLVTADSCDPLSRRAVRVSMGTVFQIPWTILPSDGYFSILSGFTTVAMALRNDSVTISDPKLSVDRLAIFLGAEGSGLRPETIAACDYCARIPMTPQVDSLNVAAASAVAFWQLCAEQ